MTTMASFLNSALRDAMEEDENIVLFGEDVAVLGGVFRITQDLQKQFGDGRVFDTPLAESGIIGHAIGMAIAGMRPVPEIQFDGFAHPAFEQITSHLAKYRNRTRGRVTLPITVRVPYGGGIGAVEQHGESPEAYWLHTPGLLLATPGSPGDAYNLLRQCIAIDDATIFLEPKRRYWMDAEPEAETRDLPVGRALVRREGTSATIVTYGPMVKMALDAAEIAAEDGTSIEVVDMRWLNPIDDDTIAASVQKTGRCVVVHEAPGTCGLGGEVAARVMERCFTSLEAPVLRVTGWDTPYPPPKLEEFWYPDVDRILDAVDECLEY